MLGRELHRRRGHLLADDPELHRHEDPPKVWDIVEADGVRRRDALGQALAVREPDDDEDGNADREPERTRVAGAGVGGEGQDPDAEGEDGADDRRQRDLGPANRHVERRPVRAR